MKWIVVIFGLVFFTLTSCSENRNKKMGITAKDKLGFDSGYSDVNGLEMYYEIYGQGKPLVLVHGGGSTIQSNFEKVIPLFAKNRKVIAVDRHTDEQATETQT